ncbi:MAG: N-acetyltransferase family protein [Dehalococcoidia bacterium]
MHEYPLQLTVGGKPITFRMAAAGDRDRVVALARSLPEHDLLFLARDLTQDKVVEEWIADPNADIIVALDGQQMLGYAAVQRTPQRWSAHVAELRVLTATSMRGKGLGRVLTQEAFALALGMGMEKMMAQMTLDQKGAIAVFEGLGFRPEALLRDHVKDRAGQKHDLLVLSHEVARFEAQQAAYGVTEAFGA